MGPVTVVSKRVVLGWNVGSKERSEEEKLNAGFNAKQDEAGGEGGSPLEWGGGNFCENEGMNGERREGGGTGPALMI